MKYRNVLYTTLISALCLGTTSCSDFLDEMPDNRTELTPYGMSPEGKTRLETEFLKKISLQLKDGGVLIWVIPRVLFELPFSIKRTFVPLATND